MRVRATIKLRNDSMIRAREKLGWSQTDLANHCGFSVHTITALECFDFSSKNSLAHAQAAADALCLPVWCILPEELHGKTIESKRTTVADVDPDKMLPASFNQRLMLPGGDAQIVERETSEELIKHMDRLSSRVKLALSMKHGLLGEDRPCTLEQIASTMGVSKERVRQLLAKGYDQLRTLMEGGDIEPQDAESAA